MTWMKKSTTTMETREMRLEKLQLVIDERSPMRSTLCEVSHSCYGQKVIYGHVMIRGYARSCLSCLAENSETITNGGDGDSTTRTAVCNLVVPSHDAYTEGSTKSREESWKQRFRSLQTTVPDVRNVRSRRQHGTVRANHDLPRSKTWNTV